MLGETNANNLSDSSTYVSVPINYSGGFSTSYGSIHARKYGRIVMVIFDLIAPTSTGEKTICTLPEGYRPSENMYSLPALYNTIRTNAPAMNVYYDGHITATFTTTNGYYGELIFIQ